MQYHFLTNLYARASPEAKRRYYETVRRPSEQRGRGQEFNPRERFLRNFQTLAYRISAKLTE